jgi:hypothetical protein
MSHRDPIRTKHVTHQEGNEGEKIGVKRRNRTFYGAKLLKRQGDGWQSETESEENRRPISRAFREVGRGIADANRCDL